MVRLLLLRHAKSSWAAAGLADIDRPLNPRGVADAARLGERMAAEGLVPGRTLCSTALRARQTLAGIVPALLPEMPDNGEIALASELYGAGDYLGVIAARGGGAPSLMLIGHNPATHLTGRALVGPGDESLREKLESKFPTSGLAVIEFDAPSWPAIQPGAGRLVAFLMPK